MTNIYGFGFSHPSRCQFFSAESLPLKLGKTQRDFFQPTFRHWLGWCWKAFHPILPSLPASVTAGISRVALSSATQATGGSKSPKVLTHPEICLLKFLLYIYTYIYIYNYNYTYIFRMMIPNHSIMFREVESSSWVREPTNFEPDPHKLSIHFLCTDWAANSSWFQV